MSASQNLRKASYRLYPTPKQVAALAAILRSHQQLYNAALEERIDCYRARFPGMSFKSHGDGWRFTPAEDWRHGSLRLSGVGQMGGVVHTHEVVRQEA